MQTKSQQICENGLTEITQGNFVEASVYFEAALSLDPDNLDAANNLVRSLLDQGRFIEALPHAGALVVKYPSAVNWGYFALILYRLGKFTEAETAFLYSLECDPTNAVMQYNLAFNHLVLGKYEEGWERVKWRKKTANWQGREPLELPTWRGEQGKNVLLFCEQGFGDSLMLSRYIPYVQKLSKFCMINCPKELAKLFKDSFNILCADTNEFDYQCSLYDLPHIMGITLDNIPKSPYLKTDPVLLDKFANKLNSNKYKIGLVWAGGVRENRVSQLTDSRRSINLSQLTPLFQPEILDKVQFFSLQKSLKSQEVTEFPFITDLSNDIEDFADTAAIVSLLDLTITVDTSIVHLIGGLNKQALVLNRYDACAPWLSGERSIPWYGSNITEVRQNIYGDWNNPIMICRNYIQLNTVYPS